MQLSLLGLLYERGQLIRVESGLYALHWLTYAVFEFATFHSFDYNPIRRANAEFVCFPPLHSLFS